MDYPYQDAGAAINSMGQNFGNVAANLAQMRYANNYRNQQLQIMLANAMAQQQLREAQMQRLAAAGAVDEARVDSANRLGAASRMGLPAFSGAPTMEEAGINRNASLLEQALRSAALSGDVSQLMLGQNIPANNVNVNPITGAQTMGRMILGQGETAFDPNQVPMARGMVNLAKGHQPLLPTAEAGLAPGPVNTGGVNGIDPSDLSPMVNALTGVLYNLYDKTNSPSYKGAEATLPLLIKQMQQLTPAATNTASPTPFRIGRFNVIAR
jgi:hypothetical protein